MRAITEAILRAELKAEHPDIYYIPEGKILSPAAREYLNQLQIGIDFERNREKREAQNNGKTWLLMLGIRLIMKKIRRINYVKEK